MARRTVLSLDDDVAALLEAEAHRKGRSLDAVLNDHLRQSLDPPVPRKTGATRFRVPARALGARPGFDFDDIEGLLEKLEAL
jgi:plasmid stability protein